MMLSKKIIILLIVAFFLTKAVIAQFCPQVGARPAGALPVCGNVTIDMPNNEMPLLNFCVNQQIFVPGCTGRNNPNGSKDTMYDKNPFWYSFTCYQTGTFGFLVTPNNLNDDYNWQLFDITGHPPNAVYVIKTLALSGNWVGTPGVTGTSSSGTGGVFECFYDPVHNKPAISSMPTLITGHNYLLLLSHAVGTEGFRIVFGGGTADITDPVVPRLSSVTTNCNGGPLFIKFSKKLKCRTIAASDFSIFPPLANSFLTKSIGCDNSYETDSVVLRLDNSLPPGNYSLVIKEGLDGNTVSDFCDHFIPVGESIPFVVVAIPPPQMDSITAPGCAADELELVFKKSIFCSSIWPDGSEFILTGPTPATVIHAQGFKCTTGEDGLTNVIRLKLSAPLTGAGNYQIKLATGVDGNTLIDECRREINAGATLNFTTKAIVNAGFNYSIHYGCDADTIDYFHDGKNDVNTWKWNFGNQTVSSLQNPQIIYNPFGLKYTQLIVSNGGCSDTSEIIPISLGNEFKAGFEATNTICPGQPALFKDSSAGDIVSWLWDFGNGNTSNAQFPPPQYYLPPSTNTTVITKLVVTNNKGCSSTALQNITLTDRCYILVPGAFTPNNDGINDYLYPLNVFNPGSFLFKIYSRYGEVVFISTDPFKKWNGYIRGQQADAGTYIWVLHFKDHTGRYVEQKGSSILLR